MSTIVIMPGGFHPFHAGHAALYQSAKKAFPGAEVFVAATNDTKTRPFPFAIKEKLAKLAGVEPGHFVQVKSPFQPKEITNNFNPEQDVVIFVRSEKDRNESPKPGGMKKDGTPAYFQPWTGKDVQPFGKHAYMAYLPTVEFGPGIKSATEIRNVWPKLNEKRKLAMVMSLYPATQKNPKLAANVVKMLDMGMGDELAENIKVEPVAKSLRIQSTQIQPKQNIYVAPEKKTPAVVNHIKPKDGKIRDDNLTEFAPPGGDNREPDEEEILRQLASQWWNGTEQQMAKAQQTLHAMGWEIGQDESGDDDAGVFVIRAGDENGDSYIAFPHSELSLDENMGIPYPATYEEENQIHKDGPMRITAMTSESNLSESVDYLEEK